MRTLFVLGLTVTAIGSSEQPSLLDNRVVTTRVSDQSSLDPCHLITVVEQLVRPLQFGVGFENTTNCPPGWAPAPRVPMVEFPGSIRSSLDGVARARPEYAWRDLNGVVVFRPAASWAARGGWLDRHVAAFSVHSVSLHDALGALVKSMSVSASERQHVGESGALVSWEFTGGTLLEALNALVKPYGAVWNLGYWRSSGEALLVVRGFPQNDVGEMITLRP